MVKVIVKGGAGNIHKQKEYEYDKNLDKIIVTVDTATVMRAGHSVPQLMNTIYNAIESFIKEDAKLLILPEYVDIEFIKLESIIEKGVVVCDGKECGEESR